MLGIIPSGALVISSVVGRSRTAVCTSALKDMSLESFMLTGYRGKKNFVTYVSRR